MRLRHRSWIRVAHISGLALSGLALATLLGAVARGKAETPSVQAQPGPPQAPINQCTLRGQSVMPATASILNAFGQPIARFSGAPTPLVATDFPSDAQGKVGVETGFGAGSFRIRGFLEPGQLSLFTTANLAVTPGHVWIAQDRAVTLLGAGSGLLRVEKKMSTPLQQTFRAAGMCSAFSLEASAVTGFAPTGTARAYELKQEVLDVYGAPKAEVPVITLHRAPSVAALLFFGVEQRGDFIHVQYQGEVVIDGWAKASALSALPPGETADQVPSPALQRSVPQLTFPSPPKLVRPSREVSLRHLAKDADPSIGVIEPGAETYVLDQVAGWASVLPKSMNVLPPPGAQFWAKSSDLGL